MSDGRSALPESDTALGWSAAEVTTLTALAEHFVPGSTPDDYRRRARAAAAVLTANADPSDLRLLRLAIRALGTPLANLLTAGHLRGFATLESDARDDILLKMAGSRLSQRRTAFQALKRVSCFIGWADPGADGAGNPLWTRIGYAPADSVPAADPLLAPMQVDRTLIGTLELEAEVVIVGSGAGGGVIADRLSAAGRSVLVVEAGAHVSETSMSPLEAEGFGRLYLDQGTTATGDLAITVLAGGGLGGGTTVNWTTSCPPPDWIRSNWTAAHGLEGFDTAETDADIARLHEELGVQEPTVIPAKDQLILDGAAVLGWSASPTQRNAGPCTDCGACGFGCRSGSKRSGLRAHLASAAARGARILVDALVERVEISEGRATGVRGWLRAADGAPRREFRIRAGAVVMAAGALRTPLILQRSGLGHGGIGANLRLHPVVAIAARMPQPVRMWEGPNQAAWCLEFARSGDAALDGSGPAHGGFVIESAPPHPGLAASAFPWEGTRRTEATMLSLSQLSPLIALIHDSDGGTVSWSRRGRPRIAYRLGAAARQTARRALVEMSRLARAAGALEIMTVATPPDRILLETNSEPAWEAFLRRQSVADMGANRTSLFSAHQMGTARAGADPAAHPCDPYGRLRTDERGAVVPGLYVGDASLLPGAPGVNPMLTVMLLAERTARAVLSD